MDGNGQSKVTINVREVMRGQVIFTIKGSVIERHASVALGRAILDWTKAHPDCEVVTTLPIVSGGNTVAVHLWYYKE
jgi:hypothetical protein